MSRQNILITGAASGLGKALAIELVNDDANLILLDISAIGLAQTQAQIQSLGGQCTIHQQDISDTDALTSWVNTLQKSLAIDWLINCAGVTLTSSTFDISTEQWENLLSVNLLGSIVLSTAIGQQMTLRRRGKIINISSMFGFLPAPSGIAYATTKHALIGFTRTLSVEMHNTGVDVHLVCPGFIQTQLFEHAEYNQVVKQNILPNTQNMMTTTEAAKRIVQQVQRNKQWIIFPFYVRMLLWLEWYTPRLARHIWVKQWMDFLQKRSM